MTEIKRKKRTKKESKRPNGLTKKRTKEKQRKEEQQKGTIKERNEKCIKKGKTEE